jgi:methylmalonyl-CoA mutase N-terminal domain/subunit
VTGYGSAAATNRRLKLQIEQGVSGLSVANDVPSDLGVDADHPLAKDDVGVGGVPLYTLQDMLDLFEGIPMDKISMSFDDPCAGTAPVNLAHYVVAAERQGVSLASLRGSIQNDPLHARFCGFRPNNPVDLGVKMAVDIIEFSNRYMPQWNTTTVNMYDLRETGIDATQEIAFGLSIAMAYVEKALERGLNIDEFAPRLAFYCSAHIDFFEEIAKLRAARRMWARLMREKYGAKDPRSWRFRFGVHTAGCSLVPQQPLNNAIRVAYEALAAVLAGVQSLHTCAYDEPFGLPTPEAQELAIRTQQILAYETGVANVADPLGGSYYIESLTNKLEEEASEILKEIESLGGAPEAAKDGGYFDQEIAKAALKRQQEIETGDRIIVGVNAFTTPAGKEPPGGVYRVPEEERQATLDSLKRVKETRDEKKLREAIARLHDQAIKGEKVNFIPAIIEAVKAGGTLLEINGTIREAYGYSYDPLGVLQSPFK